MFVFPKYPLMEFNFHICFDVCCRWDIFPKYYLMDILSCLIIVGHLQKISGWNSIFTSVLMFVVSKIYIQISFDGYSRWFDYHSSKIFLDEIWYSHLFWCSLSVRLIYKISFDGIRYSHLFWCTTLDGAHSDSLSPIWAISATYFYSKNPNTFASNEDIIWSRNSFIVVNFNNCDWNCYTCGLINIHIDWNHNISLAHVF